MDASNLRPARTLDMSGSFCPVPIIETAKAVRALPLGEVLLVIGTDPGIESDMAAWCRATKNDLLGVARDGRVLRAWVRKRGGG